LRACLRIQENARSVFGVVPWCAFIDPTGSLYAPGVHASGVDLQRLLVVRPDEDSIIRVTLRLVESKVFPLVIVDLKGLPGERFEPSLNAWVRVVRRLSQALEGTSHSVLLLTDKNAKRTLPLPVTERLLLSRRSVTDLQVTVSKAVSGHPGQAQIRFARRSAAETEPVFATKAHAG
jgi:recombination protein RecA